MNSLSEKISRTLARIATVGLILSIFKIPAFRQGSRFRSGRLRSRAHGSAGNHDDWFSGTMAAMSWVEDIRQNPYQLASSDY